MGRISLGAATVLVAGCIAGAAHGADFSYGPRGPYTVNQPLNVYSWAGPYIGANIGYAWGHTKNNPTNPSGFNGGLQAGYNFPTQGPWVIGIEGDLQLSGADDRFAFWKFSNPWFGTLRGRVGYALNNVMFYGTGGLAFGGLRASVPGATESHSSLGWAAGAGVEFGLTQNWTAKVEYLYVDLSSSTFALTGMQNGYSFGTVRLGVNYHF